MSLLIYECGRSDYGHEIRQWTAIKQSLYDYYQGRVELALLIINFNISNIALDGLLIKEDAIVLVELKDRSGTIIARQNGEWECDDDPMHPIVHGGSNKTLFEQLCVNRRTLSSALQENGYLPDKKTKDIQGLVVFTNLVKLKSDFDRKTKSWIHVTDVEKIGGAMHDIKSRSYKDPISGSVSTVHFGQKDIFNFIRKARLDERSLVVDYSDTHLLPEDLFHPDSPHNGDAFSQGTLLANNIKQIEAIFSQIDELSKLVVTLQSDPEAMNGTIRHKALLDAKKELAEKNIEGIVLRIHLAEQEIQFLETKFDRISRRNAPEDEQLSLLKFIDDKNNELAEFLSKEATKRKELDTLLDEIKKYDNVEENCHGIAELQSTDNFLGENNCIHQAYKENHQFNSSLKTSHNPIVNNFYVAESFMDDDQMDVLECTNDANMLVTGPAGCGKSLVAVHKAKKLITEGKSVVLIAFTKSLRAFMHQENKDYPYFYHYWRWKKEGCPQADYVIVDEIQDFTYDEIQEFINAAKKHYFFFGDTAQSIMTMENRKPLSIETLSDKLGITPLRLFSNYRLPRTVARITQDFVGIGVQKFSEKIYKSKENELPSIIGYKSQEEELEGMLRIMQKHMLSNIGILVGDNDSVIFLRDWLFDKGIQIEYKWNSKENWKHSNTLDFASSIPKIMTYHSAKGLQFQTVILPSYRGANDDISRKSLYVAMTRTLQNLYILHHESELAKPLIDVPAHLYRTNE